MSEQELPTEVSRGTIHVAPGLDIEVVMLSDGRRVVTPETMKSFLEWLADAPNQERGKFTGRDDNILNGITHWMPLPAPPKGATEP